MTRNDPESEADDYGHNMVKFLSPSPTQTSQERSWRRTLVQRAMVEERIDEDMLTLGYFAVIDFPSSKLRITPPVPTSKMPTIIVNTLHDTYLTCYPTYFT